MRTLVQLILEDVDPVNFPASKILQASSLDSGLIEIPALPFVVHRVSIGRRTPSNRSALSLDTWVYDEPGSYRRIDKMLRDIRLVMLNVQNRWLPDRSEHIATVDWVNDSADLPAEEYKAITRMSTFTLVGSTA